MCLCHCSNQEMFNQLNVCWLLFCRLIFNSVLYDHFMPQIKHGMAFRMSQFYISVCVALLFVLPCCDCHEIVTQNQTEEVKVMTGRFVSFSTLHDNQNNLYSHSNFPDKVTQCFKLQTQAQFKTLIHVLITNLDLGRANKAVRVPPVHMVICTSQK